MSSGADVTQRIGGIRLFAATLSAAGRREILSAPGIPAQRSGRRGEASTGDRAKFVFGARRRPAIGVPAQAPESLEKGGSRAVR